MRCLAILCSLSLWSAACGSATGASERTANSTATPAPSTATASPTLVAPTATPARSTTAWVTILDNSFAPEEVSVGVGTTVEWQSQGENPHDVVAADGTFTSSSPLSRGNIFSYTFTKPGEYAYFCSFHIAEHMSGTVIVK